MRHLHNRRTEAVENLPPLPRTLFLLHNFYNVGLDDMAARLGAGPDAISACFAEARAMVHAHVCFREARRFNPDRRGRPIAELEARLQHEYRRSLETAFAESGYGGAVDWPGRSAGIGADEVAAAAFIVALLPGELHKATTKAPRTGVTAVDLWRFIGPWRPWSRRRLLRVTEAVRCAGWQPFDEWLARRIAPARLYPHGNREPPQRLRRLLHEEGPVGENAAEVADTVRVPERLMSQPLGTQQVWVLFHHYERSVEEIARRLGLGRRRVERLRERADFAIIGMSYPSLGERIRFDLMVMRLGLELKWEIFRSIFYR